MSSAGADRHSTPGRRPIGPLSTVSGKVRWSDKDDFYIEGDGRRLRLELTRPMATRADELLHQHVTAHGWFEASDLFAVHSLASSEDDEG